MKEIAVIRRGNTLVPVDDMAAEEIGRLREGKEALITVRVPRNARHHRLAWALAHKLAGMVNGLHDDEDAMTMLKLRCRHVDYFADPLTGKVQIIPRSINFASLDQTAFSRLWDRMTWVVCSEIVPGLDEEALRREILEMVDGGITERARAAA
jgi:hypothetical protein